MTNIAHPSTRLKPEWINTIRSEAHIAEKKGSLTNAQLKLIYDQAWFRLFVPKKNSSLEISLPKALFLEEALSWADGSLGWTVTLCSGAGWFSGFFDFDLAKEVFNHKNVCLGGSGAPTGTASRTENGYLISGKWKYATGADHLTHFTANCIIKEGNETILNDDGETLIMPFVFEKSDVSIIRDWQTIGLIATSSQSFEVNNLFVSSSKCFKVALEALQSPQPVYKYPFLQFAEVTLAVNISGMALHFFDCCKDVFSQRIESKRFKEDQHAFLLDNLSTAENKLSKARSAYYKVIEESWKIIIEDIALPQGMLQQISRASRNLAATSHNVVNSLYPLCGLAAANPTSEINRVWRDIHTASQHTLLTFP
ncbi:MAG: acyl-CoA dehydrogenase [Pyrinomonadaceae bacterium]|nr:acyl-CoA dehydrogenase [Sphingobacteriaceae bacterium]